MDVFALRDRLISEYASYISSFINIADARIREHVDAELRNGLLWPDPLVQLNPNFEPGALIEELVAADSFHAECASVFRVKGTDGSSKPLRLHRHQADSRHKYKTSKGPFCERFCLYRQPPVLSGETHQRTGS